MRFSASSSSGVCSSGVESLGVEEEGGGLDGLRGRVDGTGLEEGAEGRVAEVLDLEDGLEGMLDLVELSEVDLVEIEEVERGLTLVGGLKDVAVGIESLEVVMLVSGKDEDLEEVVDEDLEVLVSEIEDEGLEDIGGMGCSGLMVVLGLEAVSSAWSALVVLMSFWSLMIFFSILRSPCLICIA